MILRKDFRIMVDHDLICSAVELSSFVVFTSMKIFKKIRQGM